jgi:hypothetical protein
MLGEPTRARPGIKKQLFFPAGVAYISQYHVLFFGFIIEDYCPITYFVFNAYHI